MRLKLSSAPLNYKKKIHVTITVFIKKREKRTSNGPISLALRYLIPIN